MCFLITNVAYACIQWYGPSVCNIFIKLKYDTGIIVEFGDAVYSLTSNLSFNYISKFTFLIYFL
jgi:hypothetical protein